MIVILMKFYFTGMIFRILVRFCIYEKSEVKLFFRHITGNAKKLTYYPEQGLFSSICNLLHNFEDKQCNDKQTDRPIDRYQFILE